MRVIASMPYDDLPENLTVKEASAWLSIHHNEIYRAIASGDIIANRAGRKRIRIPKGNLKAWMERAINPS